MMNRSTVLQLGQLPLSRRPSLKFMMMGALSTLSLVSGLLLTEVAHAQSPAEIAQYTNIAKQIERQRMQDYAEVKQLMGGNVPENVCQQGNLPPQVRKICDRFDARSREIIISNGMTVPKFNEITRYCQKSPKPAECPR